MSNQIPQGQIGLAWGIGQLARDNAYNGYVQAYIAQGHDLATAQRMADVALGITRLTPAQVSRRRMRISGGWMIAFYAFALVFLVGGFGFTQSLVGFVPAALFHVVFLRHRADMLAAQRSEGHA